MTSSRALRALGFGASAVVLALVLAATVSAASGSKRSTSVKNGGTLVIGLESDPDALDPTLARTFVGRIVFLHLCEKLYDLDAKLHIVPQLAAALPTVS
jgi:peptide/nickel transport system substrate-binding protein